MSRQSTWRPYEEAAALSSCKPNFFLIGAAKCATTWLTICLNEHPEIFMPRDEPHYFSWKYEMFRPLSEVYSKIFEDALGVTHIGENSNTYLTDPGAIPRIESSLHEPQYIACIREPVARAYSDYCMHFRTGRVGDKPEDYLYPGRSRWPDFIRTGEYSTHLARIWNFVPKERVHVVLYQDVQERPGEAIEGIFSFLKVSVDYLPEFATKTVNRASDGEMPVRLRRAMNQSLSGRLVAAGLRATGLSRRLREATKRPIRYPELSAELQAVLKEHYRPFNESLRQMIGNDLEEWS